MNILIIGDNANSRILSKKLVLLSHSITVIGNNIENLKQIEEQIDAKIIIGKPCSPSTLKQADNKDIDLIIAISDQDETNIVACKTAFTLFNIKKSICCISNDFFTYKDKIFPPNESHQDIIINPEQIISSNLIKILKFPLSQETIISTDNQLAITSITIQKTFPIVNKNVEQILYHCTQQEQLLCILRDNKAIIFEPSTTIRSEDILIFSIPYEKNENIINWITSQPTSYQNIFIAGVGTYGQNLLQVLENNNNYYIKVIEPNLQEAKKIANLYNQVTVLHGDFNDTSLLESEDIEETDIFFALSNDDEDNLVSALQAKNYNIKTITTLVNQPELIPIVEKNTIHSAISPQQLISKAIIQQINFNNTIYIHKLKKTPSIVIEFKISKNLNNIKIKDLKIPDYAVIFGLIRNNDIITINEDTTLKTEDNINIFLTNNKYINKIQKIFNS